MKAGELKPASNADLGIEIAPSAQTLHAEARQVSADDHGSTRSDHSLDAHPAAPLPPRAGDPEPEPPRPARPIRSGTAILGRYNEHLHDIHAQHAHQDRLDPHSAGHHGIDLHGVAETLHIDDEHIAARKAHAMQAAKDRGIATPGLIDHMAATPGVNQYAVSARSLQIQAGFRKKMLTILFLQVAFSVALGFLLRYTPSLKEPLEWAFPPQGTTSLILMCCVLLGVPIMSCIKDKHPWNLFFCLFWSVILGVFLAASDLEGAYARGHAFLMIMSMLTAGILLLTIFSQIRTRDVEGQPALLGFGVSGTISWLVWLIGAIICFTQVKDKVDWQEPDADDGTPYDPAPVFVTSIIVSTIVYTWFCYESYKLCCKMQPDEYMKGVIYFYTDMFYVCACCALLACLGGGGGNGAPPKDEEER